MSRLRLKAGRVYTNRGRPRRPSGSLTKEERNVFSMNCPGYGERVKDLLPSSVTRLHFALSKSSTTMDSFKASSTVNQAKKRFPSVRKAQARLGAAFPAL